MALARLVVFNKRRANEPASLLLSQYLARPDWKQNYRICVKCIQFNCGALRVVNLYIDDKNVD